MSTPSPASRSNPASPTPVPVPLLDIGRENRALEAEIQAAISQVCQKGSFVLGPDCQKLEQQIAQLCQARFGIGCASGSDALLLALMALDVRPGDEVLVPSFTFFATASAVWRLGAKPVFVDIEPVTFNIDPSQIESKITPRTKAIVAQHTYGYPAAMDAIVDIANRKGLPLVEDCCLALGSKFDGRLCGTFGLAAYFSSQWNKPYTTGLGGMAVTSDADLAGRIRALVDRECVRPGFSEVAMLAAQLAVHRALVYPRTTALAQNLFRFLTRAGLVVGSSSTDELQPTPLPGLLQGDEQRAEAQRSIATAPGYAQRGASSPDVPGLRSPSGRAKLGPALRFPRSSTPCSCVTPSGGRQATCVRDCSPATSSRSGAGSNARCTPSRHRWRPTDTTRACAPRPIAPASKR